MNDIKIQLTYFIAQKVDNKLYQNIIYMFTFLLILLHLFYLLLVYIIFCVYHVCIVTFLALYVSDHFVESFL